MNVSLVIATLRRLPAWLVLAATGSGLIVTGQVMEVLAADPPPPVKIKGAGDSDFAAELVTWQNDLLGGDQPIEFSFFSLGTKDSRRKLLEGTQDYVTGGVPFTAAELAGRPANAGEIIEVPLNVTSLTIIATDPTADKGGWDLAVPDEECLADPANDPFDCGFIYSLYEGPIRIPPDNLAALFMQLNQTGPFADELRRWSSASMKEATADGGLVIEQVPGKYHSVLNRTEGSAVNKYIMEYAQQLAPSTWQLVKDAYPAFPYEPISEQMSTRQKSRAGFDTQVQSIMHNADVFSLGDFGAKPDQWTGNIGAIPTTFVQALPERFPSASFRKVEIQNRHGDWLLPTRAAVDAALAAGTTPNVGVDQDVAGAYPLAYVDHLYTIAGSLTPDKANALAATVRYIATDGQALMIEHGGTSLPAALQAEALAKADHIVEANCTAAGYEVVTSGPGPFEPNTPGVQALTSMKHCQVAPVPETTTTTIAPTTTSTTTTTTIAATTTTVAPTTSTSAATTTTSSTTTTTAALASSPVTPSTAAVYVPPYVPPQTSPAYVPPAYVPPETAVATATSSEPTTVVAQEEATTTIAAETSTTTVETSTTIPTGPSTTVRARGVALSELPMKPPSNGSNGPKSLGTLMLGCALFLGPRKYLMARRAAQ